MHFHPCFTASMLISPGGIAGISIAGMVLVVIIIAKVVYFYLRSKRIREPRLHRNHINISQIALGASDLHIPRDMLAREPPPMYSSDMNIAVSVNPSAYELPTPPPIYSSRNNIHGVVSGPRLELPPQYSSRDMLNTSSETISTICNNSLRTIPPKEDGPESLPSVSGLKCNQPKSSVSKSCDNITGDNLISKQNSASHLNYNSSSKKEGKAKGLLSKFKSCPDVLKAKSHQNLTNDKEDEDFIESTNKENTDLEQGIPYEDKINKTCLSRDDGCYENRAYEESEPEGASAFPTQHCPKPISDEKRQRIEKNAALQARILVDGSGLPPRHPGCKRMKKNKKSSKKEILEGRVSHNPQGVIHSREPRSHREPSRESRNTREISTEPGSSTRVTEESIYQKPECTYHENTCILTDEPQSSSNRAGIVEAQPISRSLNNLVHLSAYRERKGSLSSVNTWNC